MKFLSHAALAALLAICLIALSFAQAEDKRKPVAEMEVKAPAALPKDYKKAMPEKAGVFAAASEVALITSRGGFGLSGGGGTGAVFEYQQMGYDEKLQFQTLSTDGFLWYQCDKHQIQVVIRNKSPFDVWLFVNGTQLVSYVPSASFYPLAP